MHKHLIMAVVAISLATTAGAQSRGIVGKPAPKWQVTEWTNLPDGRTSLDIADYRGKVLYLYCFQSWCPGCHSRGFPTLNQLIEHYDGNDDVEFVTVQTTFEGFDANTAERAWATAKQYDLAIPVGHSGSNGKRSKLMRSYRTGGTPWVIIIDRNGTVRYNDFHVTRAKATGLIDRLVAEPARPDTKKPASDDAPARARETPTGPGADVIGTPFPKLADDHMIVRDESDGPAVATLYRWWTDSCPFCEASLPAIERLRQRYGKHGLKIVAIYHPKPPRDVANEAITEAARSLGYRGAVAADLDWSMLRGFYLSKKRRPATSASFLVDAKGVIRYVHPGPQFFPSDNPADRRANADYVALDRAIRDLLQAAKAEGTAEPARP